MSFLTRWFRLSNVTRKVCSPRHRSRPLVERLEDRRLPATFTVSTLADAGAGSLRQALLDANATAGADVITFQVAGTIRLKSGALPAVTDVINIDGTTAPGFGGTPLVEVDAKGFGGLRFNAGSAGSALRSLGLVNAAGDGVTLNAGDITVVGNYIGLGLNGQSPAGNSGNGLTITASSSTDFIGGRLARERNVISGNGGNGIALVGSTNVTVQNNFIGTDAGGTLARGNRGNGILLTAFAGGNLLGGTETGGNDPTNGVFVRPPDGNVISGNTGNGVLLNGGANDNTLEGNFIGTDVTGLKARGNNLDGVALVHAPGNALYGTSPLGTQNPFIYYNVVSGNGGNGLRITDSDGTIAQANFVGLGSDNMTPVGNGLNGVLVEGSSADTMFGGAIPLGNVVAANGQNGVVVQDTATGFESFNTFCGEGAFVTYTNLGNRLDGFLITSTGGNNLLLVNQVDNSGRDGVEICGEASGVQVTISIIGGFINGTVALPNRDNGIEVGGNAHGNVIGGPAPPHKIGSHNVISANLGYGVAFTGTAHNNQLNFSFIGTDVQGNVKGGVLLGPGTYANTVGSTDSSLPTVIGDNLGDGIDMDRTRGNNVIGTQIGAEADARGNEIPRPNAGDGIRIVKSSGNVIGGTASGDGNVIAFNQGNGVFVKSGDGNTISGNSIYRNADLGIRLAQGANNNQAAPVLTSAVSLPGGVRVSGTITSTPNTVFTIELFAGGGKTFLGSVQVTTDANGVASFTFDGLPAGDNDFVATATDPAGNTSEFSLPLSVG
jgi:parallel beta-helix repeat protein